jgi:hypothetical protein
VLVIHGTRKFIDRMGCTLAPPETSSSTQLGSWFATVLFWRPWVALFVNEKTLVPLLIPFAPAASMFNRFVPALAALLEAHGVERDFISAPAVLTDGRVGEKIGAGLPADAVSSLAFEAAIQPGAGAPCWRVAHCRYEHAGQTSEFPTGPPGRPTQRTYPT